MLGFRKAKTDAVSGFLGSQTEFVGKLAFSGVVHLDGVFHGEIISRGTLVVGSESVVHASIHSAVLKISGEVHGDLTATERIEMFPPAKVYGSIKSPVLVIEEGVVFEGVCSMIAAKPEIPQLVDTKPEPMDEEAVEAISAQAWPLEFDENLSLDPDESPKEGPHKHSS
jgi:cytoskeletal protein CcmA (bactofilin family)